MTPSILIVDDEERVRHMLRTVMEGQGYGVLDAASAEQALEVVSLAPVDVVITDLKMPGMDGLALAKKLLEQDADRPVLLMTAHADLDNARQAIETGVYEFFVKPFDINDVASGIRRAVERRQLVLQNREYQRNLERMVEQRTRELEQSLREMDARDKLLLHLLSIQEPEETLSLAIQLAMGLCDCDAGAIYCPDAEGVFSLRAAVGFLEEATPVRGKTLADLGLEDGLLSTLQEAASTQSAVCLHELDAVRKGFGMHSSALLPVWRVGEVFALLEVDRRRRDVLVGGSDLAPLEGFLPYVAMAVADCKLQEDLPAWEEDVEQALKATDEWTQ